MPDKFKRDKKTYQASANVRTRHPTKKMSYYYVWKFAKYILTLFTGLIFTALLAPPLKLVFAELGWHSHPNRIVSDTLNWIERIIGEKEFIWISSSIITLTLTLWLTPKLQTLHKWIRFKNVKTEIKSLDRNINISSTNQSGGITALKVDKE